MRATILALILLQPCVLHPRALTAQAVAPATTPSVTHDLTTALAGSWTGLLEYRDYSEPATSTKRVQLPTWLTITTAGNALTWHYIYDDGPTKTVEETDLVTFDPAAGTYAEAANGKAARVYSVVGYDKLTQGRGQLVLTATGSDNDKPAELRVTLTIRRNLLEMLEEVRAKGSTSDTTGAFQFRHRFVFTRAQPPALPAATAK